jgi:hypothetical protein
LTWSSTTDVKRRLGIKRKKEIDMNLQVTIQGIGGHTEVNFEDGRVKLSWKETTMRERKMLREMIEKAKSGGMKTYGVDSNGNADKETDVVPGTIFNRSGELVLKGEGALVTILAKGLIEAEQKSGRLVMEAQEDNTWKILRSGDTVEEGKPEKGEEKEEKKKKVHTTAKQAGG